LKGHFLSNFAALGLSKTLLSKLEADGFTDPTPIQTRAIPLVLEGRDIMGLAQTGTGKTAAFGLPLIHKLLSPSFKPAPKTVRALILAPTRELAKQISDNLVGFVRGTPLKINVVVGGMPMPKQIKLLSNGTDILVATPGRLLDLINRRAVVLNETGFLVLDEADQMLDMGFIHDLRKIASHLPAKRQTLLFSATMPKLMAELAQTYLNDAVRVSVSPEGAVADRIDQSVHFIAQAEKTALLKEYLAKNPSERSIVFSRTKHGAERLMKSLAGAGFAASSIHGNKSQGQRTRALQGFKDGQIKVLVATDVAARGIDIPKVKYVYNFDLPNVPENYIHRIGRTARAGEGGTAIALCAPAEMKELRAIEKVMKSSIEVGAGIPWEPVPGQEKKSGRSRGGKGGGGGGGKPGGNRRWSNKRPSRQSRAA